MSGIAVAFDLRGGLRASAAVGVMLGAMRYRALDGVASASLGEVAMGVARLIVTPQEAVESQPLASPRTGCMLVADARLDARRELMALLGVPPSQDPSDAELVLLAYEEWGLEAFPRLLGDFAVVIWDPREHRLLCARDTSGQRQLFYALHDGVFYAASEIHPIIRASDIPVEPNEDRIRNFLSPMEMFTNEKQYADTFYKGIHSVEAGGVVVVTSSGVRRERYWELGAVREIRYRREEEYAEHLWEVFSRCVGDRLRCVGPVGVLLSGGLDSSSIACTAQALATRGELPAFPGIRGFTSLFEGMACDEREFVEVIRDACGVPVDFVRSDSYAGRLDLAPTGFRESPNMSISEPRNQLFGRITRAGVRLLLSGQVGDSIVYGSHLVFDSLLRKGQWREMLFRMRTYRRLSQDSWRNILVLHTLLPLLPLRLHRRLLAVHVRRQYLRRWDRFLPTWIHPAIRDDLVSRSLDRSLQLTATRLFSSPAREEERRLLYPPEVLRFPSPWPVEQSLPYADRRLHEYLLGVPPEVKYRPHPETDEFYAGSKRLLRQAMRGILPEPIRTRTSKTVFADVLPAELASSWRSYEAAFGPGGTPRIAERGYVDPRLFWERLVALRDGRSGSDAVYLMQLVGLETWLRSLEQPRERLTVVQEVAVT